MPDAADEPEAARDMQEQIDELRGRVDALYDIMMAAARAAAVALPAGNVTVIRRHSQQDG